MFCIRTQNYDYFISITFNLCLGAQQNGLIEMVLLSTHNICFAFEILKKTLHTLIKWHG